MFLLFVNYIAIGLGLLGMLVPLHGKSYSPSWKTNRFLNLSWAFSLPKSPLKDSCICFERPTATHLLAWVLLNFTQGPFPSLIFRPDNFSYAMVPLTGVPWKNQPIMSYSWLGFISQIKIRMFNVSVSDSYIPICHSSVEGLGPTYQRKDIFDFTTLKGDYHLTTSWCYINNSKGPTFMGPIVFRASTCNENLVSKLTKSSNLTGKNSYCILSTGHHKCISTKYTTGVKKTCITTFPPPVPPSFTSSLNVPDYLFPGDTSQAQDNNT
jgi:hypothetical protein